MTTTTAPLTPAKRRWRNFLLDTSFQLKLTGYIVSVTLVLSALLGVVLVRGAQALMRETAAAVEARSQAAEVSRELSGATLSNELLTRMDDPAFEATFREKAKAIDAAYEAERAAIVAQRAELERQQKLTGWALGGFLVAFIAVVGLGTIVVTHKVAGPLFRIRRLVQEVQEGHLRAPQHGLRDGDELQDLFEATRKMVQRLREQSEEDARTLSNALEVAERSGASAELLHELRALDARYRARLAD
ncbi:HAMP domain-containing protein [Corallococcus macrosporus]|uniref:HAMP domain-containing protein n=2 Tax=Myxococcaceae TaxID=31 RepID=A0A250K1F3_9BACT|nr:HAMP domain-containing protein [Corallococcus macrosporus]AEI69169.1 HAMP domain-containing protein [Corallococcus macrosporus]ATB49934.1 HAMP domain-containing protein [Corallococcus macrosporus DSM 14697]